MTTSLPSDGQPDRAAVLDKLLTQLLNRRVTIEQRMFDAANGKRAMPDADELRRWAIELGTPSAGVQEVDRSKEGRNRGRVLGNNVQALMDAGMSFAKALDTTLKAYDHPAPTSGVDLDDEPGAAGKALAIKEHREKLERTTGMLVSDPAAPLQPHQHPSSRRFVAANHPGVLGTRVLNALEVLERMDMPDSEVINADEFLRLMGKANLWVIASPLTDGVAPSAPILGYRVHASYFQKWESIPKPLRGEAIPLVAACGVQPSDGGQR